MSWYRRSGNIKIGLFILGIVLVGSLLGYSQWIVNELREDNREIVQLYAELIAKTVNEKSDANLNFVFDEIIKKVQFPIIYANVEDYPVYFKNLPEPMDEKKLLSEQSAMDKQNSPIPLAFLLENGVEIPLGYLHYGDSGLIRRLQWLPYLEIGSVALFIFLGFAGFSVIRNSEKRHIWVGLARETAHQLGTPVSALMGWVELLKANPDKTASVVEEMEADLERLTQVSDRFSKMGTNVEFQSVNLKNMVENIITYLTRRLPSIGKNICLEVKGEANINIKGNMTLLSWAVENIVRNGIDAIEREDGLIHLMIESENGLAILRVKDNGKGIPKKDWKNIFRPGFSNKSRGWGLGLSLVKRIIEEIHHGEIKVVSSSLKRGTTIEVKFK